MTGARRVRLQLTFFALLSTLTISVVALRYAQIPQLVGWGRYDVTTTLPNTGGLSKISLVTYRGVEVGKVRSVDLGPSGVVVRFAVDHAADVPDDVVAQVHSMSAIGEQYLDLVPRTGKSSGRLASGATVPADPTQPVPVDSGSVLSNANALITSVDPKTLSTTVDEVADAFGGRADDIGSLIDSSSSLVTAASTNLDATKSLLRDLGPVLGTQVAVGPDVVATSKNLALLSAALADGDKDLRTIVTQGPAVTSALSDVVRGVHPTLPIVLANLGATGQVLTVYDAGLRQILVLLPATYAQLLSSGAGPEKVGGRLNFRLNIQDPAPCRSGYTTAHRDPSDVSSPKVIADSYCKAPSDSQLAVRGARNSPCPNSQARAAKASGCGLDFTDAVTVTTTSYDPATGEYVGANGARYRISAPGQGRSPDASNLLSALQPPRPPS